MNNPIDNSATSPKLQRASDPSKATICLVCGWLYMGDPVEHWKKKGHSALLRDQTLYCIDCDQTFTANDFDDRINNMMIAIATSIADRLLKTMT